jgi:hypothetical protein
MELRNSTKLDSARLVRTFNGYLQGWNGRNLKVYVRYSRGADFSGTCRYDCGHIYINIGRHVRYPYCMDTNLARARSNARSWWKPSYRIHLADAYQLTLFVFLHELYHWLVKKARRNPRQKESMCDRFAARALVDNYGVEVVDSRGHRVDRQQWDFQDLDGFVHAARSSPRVGAPNRKSKAARSS